MHFPPVEEETPKESKPEVSHSAEALAATLPDAPTSDPNAGEHVAKKAKIDEADKSEDDWEKVDKAESEKLDDEPVKVGKGSTATDVESVSSAADLESSTEGKE